MKMKLIGLALAVMAPLAAHATEANGIGYSYVQLDYLYADASQARADADGGAVSGSYAFSDNLFGFASFSNVGAKHEDARARTWLLGSGFAADIGNRADWVTRVAFFRADVKSTDCVDRSCHVQLTERDHATGGWITTGVMGRITDKLTANAYVGFQDVENNDARGTAFADLGAVYALSPVWRLHGGVNIGEGANTYSAGVRASF